MSHELLSGGKPCNDAQMHKLAKAQGIAASQPGQGTRTTDPGTGTASDVNSSHMHPPLFGSAKDEPNQGTRTAKSGAGGCASLEGRGTMEEKA